MEDESAYFIQTKVCRIGMSVPNRPHNSRMLTPPSSIGVLACSPAIGILHGAHRLFFKNEFDNCQMVHGDDEMIIFKAA